MKLPVMAPLLLLFSALVIAGAHGARTAHLRSLLQASKVPVVDPSGNPLSLEKLQAGFPFNNQANLTQLARAYNLTTTTPNTNSAVYKDADALYMLSQAPAAAVNAAVDKFAKSLIAAAQANALADAAAAIKDTARKQETYASQRLGRAIDRLVVAQPAKSGAIFALVALLGADDPPAYYTNGFELRHTWTQALNASDQAALNGLAQASADAANAGGVLAARIWGQALGNNIGPETGALPDSKQQDAYARAVASVVCKGGANTAGWASVYSVALSFSPRAATPGCSILSKAAALAKAQNCASSSSKGLSGLLSYCKIP